MCRLQIWITVLPGKEIKLALSGSLFCEGRKGIFPQVLILVPEGAKVRCDFPGFLY